MSRLIGTIDTSQFLCYLSFCSTWRIYFSSPVTTVFYLSHEELLFRDAQHNKEVTSFEIFDLSRLVNILLVGDDHPVIGCSRRRELHL